MASRTASQRGGTIARRAQIDRIVPVSGQRPGFDQARRDAGLEQFAIPILVRRAHERAGIGARDDFRD